MHSLWNALNRISLIKQILVGLIIGIVVAMAFPAAGKELALLGVIFVGALKGIAPVLVFVLVSAALSRKQEDHESNIKDVIILYLIGTFLAAFFAVMAGPACSASPSAAFPNRRKPSSMTVPTPLRLVSSGSSAWLRLASWASSLTPFRPMVSVPSSAMLNCSVSS